MFFAAKAIVPQMQRLGGGSIINMSSIIWRLAHTGLPAYITCKAAVMGLTRTQARQYGPHDIRVNTISPGAVWTERQIKLWYTPEFEQRNHGRAVPHYAQSFPKTSPTWRFSWLPTLRQNVPPRISPSMQVGVDRLGRNGAEIE